MKTAVGDRYFSRVCCSRALFDRVAGTCLEVVVVVIVVGIVDGGAAVVLLMLPYLLLLLFALVVIVACDGLNCFLHSPSPQMFW